MQRKLFLFSSCRITCTSFVIQKSKHKGKILYILYEFLQKDLHVKGWRWGSGTYTVQQLIWDRIGLDIVRTVIVRNCLDK
jgi:hypothetical protein